MKPLALAALLVAASLTYIYKRPLDLHLTLDMASTGPSTAQLFYDVGRGFNEKDSTTASVTSNSLTSLEHLSFALPAEALRGLRFDPLTGPGRVLIRDLEITNVNTLRIKAIRLGQLKPLNQIAERIDRAHDVEFATTPGANDPALTIVLPHRLYFRWLLIPHDFAWLTGINASLAGAFFLMFGRHNLDRFFGRAANQPSAGGTLRLDALAVGTYTGLATLFCLACLLDLNGSSAGMYSDYGNGPGSQLLLGTPRAVRADEWAYVTPDILNQSFRANRFAAQDSVLGSHNISLTGNIPVKDISTLFRPQFWPFFLLPVDYAFSAYWQAKGLILVGGIFTLLLWITGSSGWALAGALWYFFSPFTQWSYSWPSAFPEMVGSLCLAVVCFCYLTVERHWPVLALSSVGLALSSINFVMCAYPPHLIPLAWVGFALSLAWLASQGSRIFTTENLWPRIAALLLAVAVIAAVGLHIYQDLKPAIAAVADTAYPGRRVLPGGTLSIWKLGSHFMQWTEDETSFPQILGNICEGSGFLWLAPLSLFCLGRLGLSRFQKAALIALWVCFLAIFCWCVFPMPPLYGRITGLDRCTGARCLPALGLANIGIVAITMAGVTQVQGRRQIVYLLAASGAFLFFLFDANQHLARFFSPLEIVLAALFLGLLTMLLVSGRGLALALLLVAPQAIMFGHVNPVERGLRQFTRSDFNHFVQSHRELLNGRWLVYSDAPPRSGFIAEAGCQVYTGTRYIPDVDHFKLFSARGLDVNTFNRLGYLDAHAIPPGEPTRFVLTSPVVVQWNVAPTDPLLPQLGIRYLAFDYKPASNLTAGLAAVNEQPVDGFWIYSLPPATATASSSPPHS